jgi:hypothetical protein
MLSSAAIKQLEKTIIDIPKIPQLVVFEQIYENGDFIGLKKQISHHDRKTRDRRIVY